MKTILIAGDIDSLPAGDTTPAPAPKPMMDVGGRPVLTRVMDIYSHFGQTDFIVATGHQSLAVKQFFANYHLMTNDVKVTTDTGQIALCPGKDAGRTITVIDTGIYSSNSARLRLLRRLVGSEPFMVSHADGLGNIDIQAMLDFHAEHGKIATVAAVCPAARSGCLDLLNGRVTTFSQHVQRHETWVSSGFFIFNPAIFDYLTDDPPPLEHGPLAQLAQDGELMAFRHFGFWQPLDTHADQRELAQYCTAETPPWLAFASGRAAPRPKLDGAGGHGGNGDISGMGRA